ncbi:uncharacterized protein F4822DRAFT_426914 [Hypoxylon trugodes]|uniref:uncharacterized protein n=1 Tax=Hypoxylon trugodes TaxID=326681 RepID=UPI0021A20686|nr:uncharacterized protein F4822DRAFT_426914 [Hypoxylon trugodes]KAI1391060.1 hypothetical protein F4822DRAFT_426914 [Hypoxylon trugodes]
MGTYRYISEHYPASAFTREDVRGGGGVAATDPYKSYGDWHPSTATTQAEIDSAFQYDTEYDDDLTSPHLFTAYLISYASHLRLCKETSHSTVCHLAIAETTQRTLEDGPALNQAGFGSADPRAGPNVDPGGSSSASNQTPERSRGGNRRNRKSDPDRRRKKQRAGPIDLKVTSGSKYFACPYYLHDREQHWRCNSYKLKRIVDVRQHIRRKHVQQNHCPICGRDFPNDPDNATRDQHISERACLPSYDFHYPGATIDQLHAMSSAASESTARNDEERWYTIWDILLPNAINRPPSPYIYDDGTSTNIHDAFDEYRRSDSFAQLMNAFPQETRERMVNGFGELLNGLSIFVDTWIGRHALHNNHDVEVPGSISLPQLSDLPQDASGMPINFPQNPTPDQNPHSLFNPSQHPFEFDANFGADYGDEYFSFE